MSVRFAIAGSVVAGASSVTNSIIWLGDKDYSARPWASPLRGQYRCAILFKIAPGNFVEPGHGSNP